jgi:HNH endonuclease
MDGAQPAHAFACVAISKPRKCDATRSANAFARRARVCEKCGIDFIEGWRGSCKPKQRFCSNVCAGTSKLKWQGFTKKERKRAEHDRARARKGLPPTWIAQDRDCTVCGLVFVAKRRECVKCQSCRLSKPRITKIPKLSIIKPCVDCGTPVVGIIASKKRCKLCSRKRSRDRRRLLHGKVNKHRHRAKRFGVEYVAINPIKVFDRDSWRCQICDRKTPKRLRGTYADNAPELDHRVPMALGGSHTWGNVQCSCRSCNMSKGAKKVLGQISMFPNI